jgi:hypothetical protein
MMSHFSVGLGIFNLGKFHAEAPLESGSIIY